MSTHPLTNSIILAGYVFTAALSTPVKASDTTAEPSPKPFSDSSLQGWSERSFEGNTRYELVDDNGIAVLRGQTLKQASILYREESVDLTKTPVINWTWKINGTYQNIDEQTREGDDFPARLYVVAKTGVLPWNTVAINYVWASQLPEGETWFNPFTRKAAMIAMKSGSEDAGQWSSHSRNIVEDFKNLFNKDIEEIQGYAVMVDGDNAQKEATAWFGQISFSQSPASPSSDPVTQ